MRSLAAVLSFCFTINAWAQAPMNPSPAVDTAKVRPKMVKQEEALSHSLRGYLINSEMRFERSSSQEIVDRKPLNFGFGYSASKFSVLLEYSRFNDDSGNATSFLERTHQEVVLWGRYHLWSLKNRTQKAVTNFYFGAGAGAYEEQVITTFMGASRTDKSNAKFMSGLAVGAEFSYRFTRRFAVVAAVEGRTLIANDFDPNPLWGGVLRTGVSYNLW